MRLGEGGAGGGSGAGEQGGGGKGNGTGRGGRGVGGRVGGVVKEEEELVKEGCTAAECGCCPAAVGSKLP